LQRNSRVWKDDLKGAYDGTLFWTLQGGNEKKGGTGRGFGARWLEGYEKARRRIFSRGYELGSNDVN
jgi:hypothetical protein